VLLWTTSLQIQIKKKEQQKIFSNCQNNDKEDIKQKTKGSEGITIV